MENHQIEKSAETQSNKLKISSTHSIDNRILSAYKGEPFIATPQEIQKKIIAAICVSIGVGVPAIESYNIIYSKMIAHHPTTSRMDFELAFDYNDTLDDKIKHWGLFCWEYVNEILKQYKKHQSKLVVSSWRELPVVLSEDEIEAKNKEAHEKLLAGVENIYQQWLINPNIEILVPQAYYNALDKEGLIQVTKEEKKAFYNEAKLIHMNDIRFNSSGKDVSNRIKQIISNTIGESDSIIIKNIAKGLTLISYFSKRRDKEYQK